MEKPAEPELLVDKLSSDMEPSKIRTSRAQFHIMVQFMEEHGDLSKPNDQDRDMKNATWAKLSDALNAVADVDGQSRSIDKWKKVWSDLKANTKKKALRLVRKPADGQVRLSQLEYRLLKVMHMIKTTTLAKPPGMLSRVAPPPAVLTVVPGVPSPLPPPEPAQTKQELVDMTFENIPRNPLETSKDDADEFSWPKSPSPEPPPPEPAQVMSFENCIPMEDCSVPEDCSTAPDCMETEPQVYPNKSGHTSVRDSVAVKGRESRKLSLQKLATAMLRGEARRRKESRARRLREEALERERLRMRARELKVQKKWQTICEQAFDLMDRLLSQQDPMRPLGPLRAQASTEAPEDMERWPTVLLPGTPRPMVLNPDKEQWTVGFM